MPAAIYTLSHGKVSDHLSGYTGTSMNRISVNFRIASLVLSPLEMTRILEASPDHSVIKGADRQPSTLFPKKHSWSIFLSQEGDPLAEELLLETLEKAEAVLPRMENLRAADPDVTVDFHVALACTTMPVLNLNPATLLRITRLGGSLDIDFFEPEQGSPWPGSYDWWQR